MMPKLRNLFFSRRPASRWLPLVLLLPLTLPASAQTAPGPAAISIREAIDYANQHNRNIRIAQYDEQVAQEQVKEVKGRALPQANVNGSFEDRLLLPQLVLPSGLAGPVAGGGSGEGQRIPMGLKYNSSLTAEVTQKIIDPSLWVGLQAVKTSQKLYQQQTQQVSEQTAYNIAEAYYQAIVAEKQLQLLRSNIASTQQTLQTTELQFTNGVAKQVDVNRLRVNASNLQSQIRQAELNLEQVHNRLKYQMGMPLTQPVVLTDTTLTFREDESVLANLLENFQENRLDYQILQTNLELQELDRKNNASGYYPTLSGYANYGYQGQGGNFGLFKTQNNGWLDYNTSSIGLRLNIPVFDGLQRNARIQQSRIKTIQLEENIQLTKQTIDLEVSNALTQYRNTLQRIEAEQQNVALAREVYQVTQLEFREGVGTSTAVVEAETSLRQAQNTYTTTLLDLYTARLDLEKAKGNLLGYLIQFK